MRICSSVGRVTVAVPLLVTAISFLLLLELFQYDVELLEPLRPRALVALHPVVDGLERVAVHPVEAAAAVAADVDGADLPEHPQVLRHLRLREAESLHEVVDGKLAAGEEIEDLPPARL